jgi:LPXTG-motif cell wall-anchored protein
MKKHVVALFGLIIALALCASAGTIAAQAGNQFTATLSGAEEVPDPGDADGSGTAMVTFNSDTEVCWKLNVSNITLPAAAAHIHDGPKGVAGPVVVPFTAPDANGMAEGCATADAALLTDIRNNPAEYYVNVHTSDHPGGAVRGQLVAQAGGEAPAAPAPATGGAPAMLPGTGESSSLALIMSLALAMLGAGLVFRWRMSRQ